MKPFQQADVVPRRSVPRLFRSPQCGIRGVLCIGLIVGAVQGGTMGCKKKPVAAAADVVEDGAIRIAAPMAPEANDESLRELARLRNAVTELRRAQLELSNELIRVRKENMELRAGVGRPQHTAATPSMAVDFGQGVGPLRFGMTIDDIAQALGQPDSESEPDSKGNAALVYRRFGIVPVVSNDVFIGAQFATNFAGRTAEGIGIGSRLEAIVSVFGQPIEVSRVGNGDISYNYRYGSFTIGTDGAVRHFTMRRAD